MAAPAWTATGRAKSAKRTAEASATDVRRQVAQARRRRLRDLAAHVRRARLGRPLGALGAARGGPGGRRHQGHGELQVARHLIRRGEAIDVRFHLAGVCRRGRRKHAVVIETGVEAVARQDRQPPGARLRDQRVGALDLLHGHRHRRIALQRALDGGSKRELLGPPAARAAGPAAITPAGISSTRPATASRM